MHICICIYVYVYAYTYINILYVYVYTYKYIYKYIDTSYCSELRKKNSSAREASSEIAKLVGKLQGLKRKVQTWHQEVYTYIYMLVCLFVRKFV